MYVQPVELHAHRIIQWNRREVADLRSQRVHTRNDPELRSSSVSPSIKQINTCRSANTCAVPSVNRL